MKRVLIAMAVVAACIAGGLTLWHSPEERLPNAAQLAPAEAVLLAELPDLPGSAMRWRQTALNRIINEPQVQAFLAKPKARLQQNEAWAGAVQGLGRIQPKRAFLAVEKIVNNMPRAVGGIAYAGDRREFEKLVDQARAQAQAVSPNGKLDHLKYQQFDIATFSDNGITLAGCFARNWYFIANDVDLLKATLDRLSGKTIATLSSNPAYIQSQGRLPMNPDFRLFSQPRALSNKLLAHLNASGQPLNPQESAALRKIQAVALATQLEGSNIRDTLFLYEPESPERPVLNGKTLGLTTPNTLIYGAIAPLISDEIPQRGSQPPLPGIIPMRVLLAALNSPPATLTQFKNAFGPEHAILLDWPAKTSQPSLILASEIRDSAEARRFVETVFHAWNRADTEGVSVWSLTSDSPEMAQFHPAVALTAEHFLAGLSVESLQPFASNATHPPVNGETLEKSTDFLSAMASVGKPEIGVAYLNTKPLFERVYDLLRPAAILWGNSLANLGDSVDFTKLPPTACIASHLSPICLSASQKNSGIIVESTGPISFLGLSAGLGGTVFAIALPNIQTVPKPGKGSLPGVPPFPTTPLSVPAATPVSDPNE